MHTFSQQLGLKIHQSAGEVEDLIKSPLYPQLHLAEHPGATFHCSPFLPISSSAPDLLEHILPKTAP